jgi:hypothetical protein
MYSAEFFLIPSRMDLLLRDLLSDMVGVRRCPLDCRHTLDVGQPVPKINTGWAKFIRFQLQSRIETHISCKKNCIEIKLF